MLSMNIGIGRCLARGTALALLLAGAMMASASMAKTVPENKQQIELSFAPLVRQVSPAVVNIYTRKLVEQVTRSPLFDDPFFRRFFGDSFGVPQGRRRQRMQNSLGSGVILSGDGLIVTNHHVVDGADEITVALADRREFAAELILDDERTDLAVLRIDTRGEELPFLQIRDSDDLEVGDLVLAIGNPFNVGQTVTSGIVSALARTDVGVSDFQFFIQTDAAINPGNSGGALVGMDGRLVGINSAIYSRSGGSLGIGFAVPSAMVRTVLSSAKSGLSYVQRPWLGGTTQEVTPDIAESLGLDRPSGVLLQAVHPKGPAGKSGLRAGDVILSIDGYEVDSPRALNFRLGTSTIGGETEIDYWRDRSVRRTRMALISAPEVPPRNISLLEGRQPLAGAKVANLSPALAEELGLNTLDSGVIVLEIANGSPAAQLRFRPGDRILEVDGQRIGNVRELKQAMSKYRDQWHLLVRRGDRTVPLRVRM